MRNSIPLSYFHRSTRFAIDRDRIGVIESGSYTGCMEVHLVNYNHDSRRTMPDGNGLALAGLVDSIRDGGRLYDRLALVAGFDEVFEIACNYDGVVVLRPLGIGLGVRWELARQYAGKTSRKRRNQKKYAQRSRKFLADTRRRVDLLTGMLSGWQRRATGPFFLREATRQWKSETPINALTLHQARLAAQARVEKMTAQGWKCGEEASHRGTIQPATKRTVTWLCQKHGVSKWISVEVGTPEPPSDEDVKYGERGPETYTADQITEMCATWASFNGFSGERCGRCWSDANVLACGPGWFCGCGHYNNQSWSNSNMPHELTDYGPSRAVIHAGIEKHRRNTGELQ